MSKGTNAPLEFGYPRPFTDNEVKALFIAFMATRNQQLPYLKSRQSLAEKLLGLISQNQQDDLVLLNQILRLLSGALVLQTASPESTTIRGWTSPRKVDGLSLFSLPRVKMHQKPVASISKQTCAKRNAKRCLLTHRVRPAPNEALKCHEQPRQLGNQLLNWRKRRVAIGLIAGVFACVSTRFVARNDS